MTGLSLIESTSLSFIILRYKSESINTPTQLGRNLLCGQILCRSQKQSPAVKQKKKNLLVTNAPHATPASNYLICILSWKPQTVIVCFHLLTAIVGVRAYYSIIRHSFPLTHLITGATWDMTSVLQEVQEHLCAVRLSQSHCDSA